MKILDILKVKSTIKLIRSCIPKKMPTIRRHLSFLFLLFLVACQTPTSTPIPIDDLPNFFPTSAAPISTQLPSSIVTQPTIGNFKITPTPKPLVPNFYHIVIIMLENQDYTNVIGNPLMPIYNKTAEQYTLLTQFYAITHPSLPNYIALIDGDTFSISSDCIDCFINSQSLPDLIETSGRTWKTYQEDMPSPCFVGNSGKYQQKHNPFVYFDSIRFNKTRCEQNVVPMTALQVDIKADMLPNFIFITLNICNDAHDCNLDIPDEWLTDQINLLVPALDKTNQSYLVIITFDEGVKSDSCCGLPQNVGGKITTILLSSQVKSGFQDNTPYSQYSLLKTIAASWGLPTLAMQRITMSH